MAFDLRGWGGSVDAACEDKMSDGVELCPFLRNMGVNTSFAFSKMKFPVPVPTKAGRGPIFEDGPGFESSFRLFHGKDGVVPLKRASEDSGVVTEASDNTKPNLSFHPLSASAATISLSSFGPAGPFGFDGFMENFNAKKPNKKKPKKKQPEKEHKSNVEAHMHEAMGSDWLATGQCPIAKSFRAVSGVLPLVSKMLKLPTGMKYRCPPAIVAARAALAKTPAVKALRPQALPTKVLAIGMLGMALNVPLGVWREHTKKFSPQWFLAVHATIPFIAMLRKAVVMPKYAIAFTIGSAVLGQAVGARAERLRLANLQSSTIMEPSQSPVEASSPAALTPQIVDQATIKVHSEALPVMDLAKISTTDVYAESLPIIDQATTNAADVHQRHIANIANTSEALPTIVEQAKFDVTSFHSEALPRVEKLSVQDEHPSLPTKLLSVSTPDSVLERNRSALIHHKQQDSSTDSSVDVGSPMGVPKRLTGLQNPLQCGSEALVSCSMSSSSQPALVS